MATKKSTPSTVRGGSAGSQSKTKTGNTYTPYGGNKAPQEKRNRQVKAEGEMKAETRKEETTQAYRKRQIAGQSKKK